MTFSFTKLSHLLSNLNSSVSSKNETHWKAVVQAKRSASHGLFRITHARIRPATLYPPVFSSTSLDSSQMRVVLASLEEFFH